MIFAPVVLNIHWAFNQSNETDLAADETHNDFGYSDAKFNLKDVVKYRGSPAQYTIVGLPTPNKTLLATGEEYYELYQKNTGETFIVTKEDLEVDYEAYHT